MPGWLWIAVTALAAAGGAWLLLNARRDEGQPAPAVGTTGGPGPATAAVTSPAGGASLGMAPTADVADVAGVDARVMAAVAEPEPAARPAPEPEPAARPAPEPEPAARPAPEPEPAARSASQPEPAARPEPEPEPAAWPEPASDDDVEQSEFGPGSALPAIDGSGPDGWPVKGNVDSMLYYTPGSPGYRRSPADVWFRDEETARAAGFIRWDAHHR